MLKEMFPVGHPARRRVGAFRGEAGAASMLKRLDSNVLAVALVALQDSTWTPSSRLRADEDVGVGRRSITGPRDFALAR